VQQDPDQSATHFAVGPRKSLEVQGVACEAHRLKPRKYAATPLRCGGHSGEGA